MLDRQELLTAALLGTDRRPLPGELGAPEGTDPALTLLDWAVRSGVAARAGAALARPGPAPTGPSQTLPVAPPAARDLIDRLLVRPQPELVNVWLRAAVRHGYGLAPQHWPLMAAVAARSADVSRPLLGAALGKRGQWFVGQNPQWLRLSPTLAAPPQPEPTAPGPVVDEEAVRADPEAILAAPQPWSVNLVMAASGAIGSLQLRLRTTSYAVAVGVRLPLEHHHLVQAAADYYHEHLRPGQGMILVRDAFAALEGAVQTAQEIDQAFSTDPPVLDPPVADPHVADLPVPDPQERT